MSRPLSLFIAAALVATTTAFTAAPAAAIDFGVTARSGEWGNNHWRGDRGDDRRWRHHRRDRGITPGFSFSFGVPGPRAYYRPYRDDCYRSADGALYCRAN